jgi:hypothetical protein
MINPEIEEKEWTSNCRKRKISNRN